MGAHLMFMLEREILMLVVPLVLLSRVAIMFCDKLKKTVSIGLFVEFGMFKKSVQMNQISYFKTDALKQD